MSLFTLTLAQQSEVLNFSYHYQHLFLFPLPFLLLLYFVLVHSIAGHHVNIQNAQPTYMKWWNHLLHQEDVTWGWDMNLHWCIWMSGRSTMGSLCFRSFFLAKCTVESVIDSQKLLRYRPNCGFMVFNWCKVWIAFLPLVNEYVCTELKKERKEQILGKQGIYLSCLGESLHHMQNLFTLLSVAFFE